MFFFVSFNQRKIEVNKENLKNQRKIEENKENKGNLKNTRKILKNATGKETKNVSIDKISKDGKIITDPIDRAECCNDHFAFIGQRLIANIKSTEFSSTHFVMVNTKFDFKLINAIEVYNRLKTLDKNKATGIHDIPNKMLLLCADIVAPHLEDIFNYSLVPKKFFWMILKLARYLLFLKMERERILITIDPFQSCSR